jgi:uncharacterized protein GlcG (DUF336 family)
VLADHRVALVLDLAQAVPRVVDVLVALVVVGEVACGVGGGSAQEDEDCARAGVEKL